MKHRSTFVRESIQSASLAALVTVGMLMAAFLGCVYQALLIWFAESTFNALLTLALGAALGGMTSLLQAWRVCPRGDVRAAVAVLLVLVSWSASFAFDYHLTLRRAARDGSPFSELTFRSFVHHRAEAGFRVVRREARGPWGAAPPAEPPRTYRGARVYLIWACELLEMLAPALVLAHQSFDSAHPGPAPRRMASAGVPAMREGRAEGCRASDTGPMLLAMRFHGRPPRSSLPSASPAWSEDGTRPAPGHPRHIATLFPTSRQGQAIDG